MQVKARGVQIYTCVQVASGKLAWSTAVPEAEFISPDGTRGRHFKGPTWRLENGTTVVGRKLRDHASSDPTAIPWLLLEVQSHRGDGLLATTAFIQRIHTVGGKAPAIADKKVGDQIRVPYTAEYVFYGPGSTTRL